MSQFAIHTRPTHCLFRRGPFWLALPVEVIRKIMPRPPLLDVPRSDAVLAGLCHVRGEFVPVLSLDPLLADDALPTEELILIVDDIDGSWGILADEVASLAVLELSNASDIEETGWGSAVTGWASHERGIVRIIDPVRFRELAEEALASGWPRQGFAEAVTAHQHAGVGEQLETSPSPAAGSLSREEEQ